MGDPEAKYYQIRVCGLICDSLGVFDVKKFGVEHDNRDSVREVLTLLTFSPPQTGLITVVCDRKCHIIGMKTYRNSPPSPPPFQGGSGAALPLKHTGCLSLV